MLNLVTKSKATLGLALLANMLCTLGAADNHDHRPINVAWGEDAEYSDCFSNSVKFGETEGGTARSDISIIVNSEILSFAHTITGIRVC